jgi:hypothetical protein
MKRAREPNLAVSFGIFFRGFPPFRFKRRKLYAPARTK